MPTLGLHKWIRVKSQFTSCTAKECVLCGLRRERPIVSRPQGHFQRYKETFTTPRGKQYVTFGTIPIPCPGYNEACLDFQI